MEHDNVPDVLQLAHIVTSSGGLLAGAPRMARVRRTQIFTVADQLSTTECCILAKDRSNAEAIAPATEIGFAE
jgi:hypothetical protein